MNLKIIWFRAKARYSAGRMGRRTCLPWPVLRRSSWTAGIRLSGPARNIRNRSSRRNIPARACHPARVTACWSLQPTAAAHSTPPASRLIRCLKRLRPTGYGWIMRTSAPRRSMRIIPVTARRISGDALRWRARCGGPCCMLRRWGYMSCSSMAGACMTPGLIPAGPITAGVSRTRPMT